MLCPECEKSELQAVRLSDGLLTRWVCNACGHMLSPNETLQRAEQASEEAHHGR